MEPTDPTPPQKKDIAPLTQSALLAMADGGKLRAVENEELSPVRVRPAIGHAQQAPAVVPCSRPHLVRDYVSGITLSSAMGISSLDHEALDDPVKGCAIVGGALHPRAVGALPRALASGQSNEVGDRLRCLVGIELARQLALGGRQRGGELSLARQPCGGLLERELTAQWIPSTLVRLENLVQGAPGGTSVGRRHVRGLEERERLRNID